MGYRLDAESRAALSAARAWLVDHYGQVHALSAIEVVDDVNRHYPGGWEAFLNAQREEH